MTSAADIARIRDTLRGIAAKARRPYPAAPKLPRIPRARAGIVPNPYADPFNAYGVPKVRNPYGGTLGAGVPPLPKIPGLPKVRGF